MSTELNKGTEDKNIIKSVFMQKEVQKTYCLGRRNTGHRLYGFSHDADETLIIEERTSGEAIDIIKIGEYDLDIPMLEKGESFFLCDKNRVVTITDRMRNSDGSITYFIEDKLIETEESKKSYEECNERLLNFNNEAQAYFELQKAYDQYRLTHPWRNIFAK